MLVAICFCLNLCVHTASGQAVFGSVIGTVVDPQGNAVVGAKVVVTSLSKTTAFETTSNESGNYSVTHLIPDDYKVEVSAAGFKGYAVAKITVSADTSVTLDAALTVGEVTQTVEVSGDIPQLQTDRADVDVQFNQKYVEDLPILNRNFTNFELLSPGTQKLPGFSHAATENPQGGGQIQVNGQHFSGTNFELDGTDNQDPILGIIVVNPNLDAVRRSQDCAAGLRRGIRARPLRASSECRPSRVSNDFHGTGFFFNRSSDQQARDPFTNAPGVPLASCELEAVWRIGGRADHQEQAVLLRRLPGHAANARHHQPIYRADFGSADELQSGNERQ